MEKGRDPLFFNALFSEEKKEEMGRDDSAHPRLIFLAGKKKKKDY